MINQYMAKVLVHNKVATEEQIKANWSKITDKKDIGQVLVEAGIIQPPIYIKVLAFVKNLQAKAQNQSTKTTDNSQKFAPPPENAAPIVAEKKVEQTLKIEGNNLYGEVSSSNVDVESVAGLESTSISTVQVQSNDAYSSKDLPTRFALLTGEGTPVEAPQTVCATTNLAKLIAYARKFGATDIYLYAGCSIVMRQSGALFVTSEDILDNSHISSRLTEASIGFSDGYKIIAGKNFSKTIGIAGAGRVRITVTWNDTCPSVAIRIIQQEFASLESLYLPPFCCQFAELTSGLILIAGPAFSGRSTTLASFAETIAQSRNVYLQTIEKPIERLLQSGKSVVLQREVGLHVHSGLEGIEQATQSGADVILFDSLETMSELSALLRASNAGALVFAVTNGNSITALLSNLLTSVPKTDCNAFANTLAVQLKGIIVQHLVPVVQQQGLVLAVEALKITSTMSNMLRRGEISQLAAAISSQKDKGITLDDSLQKCVESGYISGAEAWARASDSRRFACYRNEKGA